MEEKIWSRKDAAAALHISERTLIRRVEEVGIEWADESLPNGAIAKRIRDGDFNKLAAAMLVVEPLPDAGPGEGKQLSVAAGNLKLEVVRLQTVVQQQGDLIARQDTELDRLRANEARLLDMLTERQAKQEPEPVNKKGGLWARLRGK